MGTPSVKRLLAWMLGLAFVISFGQAQEKAAEPPPGLLETVPAKIAEFEKELTAKIDAARTVIDQEVAANRLKDSVAQTLRWSLRTASISFSGSDVRGVLATARVPFENAPVSAACKELETTWVGIQAKYTDLQKEVLAESRKRAIETIKNARQPEEVDRLMQAIEEARSAMERKFSWSGSGVDPMNTMNNTVGALRSLRRLIDAEASGDIRSILAAIGSLYSIGGMDREGGVDAELRSRVERIRAPYAKKVDEAQAALDAALEARKPAAEVGVLLENFAQALERMNQLRSSFEYSSGREIVKNAIVYRPALEILTSIEAKDYSTALQQIRNARNANSPDSWRPPKLSPLLAQWEEETKRQATQFMKDKVESWRARLQKVNGPADLDDLAVEITRIEQTGRAENRTAEVPAGLATTVSSLAAAWRSMNPTFLRDERMQGGSPEERQGPFATELATLRRRIQRDVIASVLKVPELNQPPLAEKSPREALEDVIRQSAQKKEWRRVIELLQAGRSLKGEDQRADAELMEALRSYVAGQNLELAEQWSDAAAAYKRVLLCTSELAPIADAAERLKALSKEHPESVSPATNSGRPIPGILRE